MTLNFNKGNFDFNADLQIHDNRFINMLHESEQIWLKTVKLNKKIVPNNW